MSAFSPEQRSEVEAICARMIGQALHGAAERIASAIVGGPVVVLPVLHMTDLVVEQRQPSPGKETYVSGERSAQ